MLTTKRGILSLALAIALSLCGCSLPFSGSGTDSAVAQPALIPAPAPAVRGACIDSTASVPIELAKGVRDAIVTDVARTIPEKPTKPQLGVSPVRGVRLEVRIVTTRPLSAVAPYVQATVPSVPGLQPRPDLTDPGAMDPSSPTGISPYDAWKNEETQWDRAYDRAIAAAKTAAAKIARLPLSAGMSGISSCLSALALDLGSASGSRFLLETDGMENVPAQIDGSLAHGEVVLIQPCTSGVASVCNATFQRLKGVLKKLRGGHIERHTAADATTAVHRWLRRQPSFEGEGK